MQSYREKCKQTVRCLNSRGFKCKLESANGRFRLVNESGDTNISPILTPKEMNLWLDGFYEMQQIHTNSPVFIVWEVYSDRKYVQDVFWSKKKADIERDKCNERAKCLGMETVYRYITNETRVD